MFNIGLGLLYKNELTISNCYFVAPRLGLKGKQIKFKRVALLWARVQALYLFALSPKQKFYFH